MANKVYVSLGFHINFYHSWRGDSADEAGFGTDIRVIREALQILNRANAAGLKARAYWDTEVYWTFQKILPIHSPDILEDIRRRVQAGLDEIVVGPFNNGANHAATEDEFRASLAWALENEWGSGLRQLFGRVAPFYRPQETMFTTGQEGILKEYGLDGIILYYAGVPFNTISSFIPPLSLEQRYNPLWFRSREDQPALILLPALGVADLYEQVSLEHLMHDLHQRQRRGEIQSDVLIHLNEDADLDTWLPMTRNKALSWFPNIGGLEEYIRVVNKYDWADFALPSEYAASHPPKTEVLVRQDLADGGFDGNYSWAEKCASLRIWSQLEASRLASCRAETLAQRTGLNLDALLWEGMDSSFFQRLIGLSTTHFGMSTPIINEERQTKALALLGNARTVAEKAERLAILASKKDPGAEALYEFEIFATPPARGLQAAPAQIALSICVVLPAEVTSLRAEDASGQPLPISITDIETLPEGRVSAQVRLSAPITPSQDLRLRLFPDQKAPGPALTSIENPWLTVQFSESAGIASFTAYGEKVGTPTFLDPFVTYGKQTWRNNGYTFEPLSEEGWHGLQRVRLKTAIPMSTHQGEFSSSLIYTFSLFDDLPYLFVDVDVCYAYTPPKQVIHNMSQKLRRLMDLHWAETAPFQLRPAFQAAQEQPLRVWKHNYMDITAWYDLNYGQFNQKNKELDSFNHQVTAGWVAVTDGKLGLLIGENAESLTSMAFCPMRLRKEEGRQVVYLNPFGSYYGKQFDYRHLGGNGNGAVVMETFSGALTPNGPSFNGETLHFSLMLAPYVGDEPPHTLQNDAAAHFYPPGLILQQAPAFLNAETSADISAFISQEQYKIQISSEEPLSSPTALLANPSERAVDLVWDAPRDELVTGYQIQWKYAGEPLWQEKDIEPVTRLRLEGLDNGRPMLFQLRARRNALFSAWIAEVECIPGAVSDASVPSMIGALPKKTLLRIVISSLWSVIRIFFTPRK